MKKLQVIAPAADVCGAPDNSAFRGKFETQLVWGEIFVVEEEKDGWCRGFCAHDHYPGHVAQKHLAPPAAPPTHIVTAARSHLYRDETIKSPALATLSFGSRIVVAETHEGFARLADGGWIYQKHLAPLAAAENDHVATALKFLETPYYWGGRSGFGIDCSGLVQVSLARAGIAAPRDTDQQEPALGRAVDTPQRGDLVYFPGHVGIMADGDHLIHANAFHMKVAIEPLAEVIRRGKGVTSIRRL